MKFHVIHSILFLMLLQYVGISTAQNLVIDTLNKTIIVKDSAKVGIIVASKGNTLNVTQNIGQYQKLNRKIEAGKFSDCENFDFEYSKKYFSWTCGWDNSSTKEEISFYFEDDNFIDSFSRIIVQIEEFPENTPKIMMREFYIPQNDENIIMVSLRNIKRPFKLTCGLILKEDEKSGIKKVYSQHCVQWN